jgi:hypothetical protein
MKINITDTTPIYRSPLDTGVFIQWNISSPPSANIEFKIERSVSPEGPFELVRDHVVSYYFFDRYRDVPAAGAGATRENLNFLSLVRTAYYRVTATASTGDIAIDVTDVGSDLPPRLARLHHKMQRDLGVALKFNGVPTYLLKRLHWGIRCKKCFDLLTKKVTSSKCESCYGVGFDGGFALPVQIKMRFLAPNSDTQMSPQGWTDTTKVRVICLEYPNIDPGDVLVTKHTNQRYLVQQQSQTELRRETVHQALVVSELSKDSIEYRITVNRETVPVMY